MNIRLFSSLRKQNNTNTTHAATNNDDDSTISSSSSSSDDESCDEAISMISNPVMTTITTSQSSPHPHDASTTCTTTAHPQQQQQNASISSHISPTASFFSHKMNQSRQNNNKNNHTTKKKNTNRNKKQHSVHDDDGDAFDLHVSPMKRQMRALRKSQRKIFRLVSRDSAGRGSTGHFNLIKHNIPLSQRFVAYRDMYHALLNLRWYKLFALCLAFYALIHFFFGLLYYLGGKGGLENSDTYDYWNCVFFSVQTFSTIGYGKVYPSSYYTNVIVSIESFVAMFAECFVLSLVIGKFTRPSLLKRQVMFSNVAVVNHKDFEGRTDDEYQYLSFRFVNMQKSQFVDAHFRLLLLHWNYEEESNDDDPLLLDYAGLHGEDLAHGTMDPNISVPYQSINDHTALLNHHVPHSNNNNSSNNSSYNHKKKKGRRALAPTVYELDFQINVQKGFARTIDHASPILPIPWTVIHRIDAHSPLYPMIQNRKLMRNIEIIAIYDAIDEATSHNIQSRFSYTKNEIFIGSAFQNCMFREKNRFAVDMKFFDEIVPCNSHDI